MAVKFFKSWGKMNHPSGYGVYGGGYGTGYGTAYGGAYGGGIGTKHIYLL